MINYIKEAEKYRPKVIKTLLVAESPPPCGKKYFYLPPREQVVKMPRDIENDRSLPATIFYHYFKTRPETKKAYIDLLNKLKERQIFLIDIYDRPIKVRNNEKNQQIILNEIPNLRKKMKERYIDVKDEDIIFLLPRNRLAGKSYKKVIKKYFPQSKVIRWKDFRMNPEC